MATRLLVPGYDPIRLEDIAVCGSLFNVVHGWFVLHLVYSGASHGNGKIGDSIWESHHKSSAQGMRRVCIGRAQGKHSPKVDRWSWSGMDWTDLDGNGFKVDWNPIRSALQPDPQPLLPIRDASHALCVWQVDDCNNGQWLLSCFLHFLKMALICSNLSMFEEFPRLHVTSFIEVERVETTSCTRFFLGSMGQALCLAILILCSIVERSELSSRPNIVFILADDIGNPLCRLKGRHAQGDNNSEF